MRARLEQRRNMKEKKQNNERKREKREKKRRSIPVLIISDQETWEFKPQISGFKNEP